MDWEDPRTIFITLLIIILLLSLGISCKRDSTNSDYSKYPSEALDYYPENSIF